MYCSWYDCVICCIYLWISLVQVCINLSPGLGRWDVEGLSDLVIAGQPKVSPSLDGYGHGIGAWELQGTIHVVCTNKIKAKLWDLKKYSYRRRATKRNTNLANPQQLCCPLSQLSVKPYPLSDRPHLGRIWNLGSTARSQIFKSCFIIECEIFWNLKVHCVAFWRIY